MDNDNIKQFFLSNNMTMEDMKEIILRSSLDLLRDCPRNFNQDPETTARIGDVLYYFNDLLNSIK